MAIEKRWEQIAPRLFAADGTSEGLITLTSTIGFKVKQIVILKSNTIPTPEVRLEVKRVVSGLFLYVGPVGNINDRFDVSAFLVADGASIEAHEQPRNDIPEKEYNRAVYAEEPIVAKRAIEVDQLGEYYDRENPFPSLTEFLRNGAAQVVTEDTSDPTNNRPLPVKLSGVQGDVIIEAENLNLQVQSEGEYDAVDNPKPDSIGLVSHERGITQDRTKQTRRITAKRGTTDTDTVNQDVSIHDHSGNQFTETNQFPTNSSIRDGTDPAKKAIVDAEGNLHIENHGNDPAGADRVLRTSEQGHSSINGIYDASSNTDPSNVGLIGHTRAVSATDSEQVQRVTAKKGTVDTNVTALDVAMNDKNGNGLTSRTYGTERSLHVSVGDGGQKDSFDRLRTSSIQSIFNAYHSQTSHPLFFEDTTTGTASSTFVAASSAVQLSVGTASGDQIIRQTKRYIHYNPGRSYLITLSGTFGDPKTNVRKRWGYFDANDGLFFEQLSTGASVVRRSSVSGTPVDTIVTQANFNIDKLDGTGLSGVTLNMNTHNLYVIDYVWQGAGRVRFGIIHNGQILYCHELRNDNSLLTPFMRTPSLPIRLELTNTGTTSGTTTVNFVCLSANKESTDVTVPSYVFSVNRGTSNITVGSGNTAPVISMRPKLTFNSITNRVPVRPKEVPIISISNPLLVQIFLNSTLTGASFVSAGTNSSVEYDTSATAVTGGTLLKTFYVGGLAGQSAVTSFGELSDILFLGLNIAGNSADIITIVVTNLGSGSTFVNAGLVFEEYQ